MDVVELGGFANLGHQEQSVPHNCHLSLILHLVDLALGDESAVSVTHDHVGPLARDVDFVAVPDELRRREAQHETLGPGLARLLVKKTVAAHHAVVCLQEEKGVLVSAQANLVSLRHLGCPLDVDSVDVHIEAERVHFARFVLLNLPQVLLISQNDLLVDEQRKVVESTQVLDLLDLRRSFELGLRLIDAQVVSDLQASS